MYSFSSWCFLCASEKDVNVEIQSLEAALKQNIGEFSIIVRIEILNTEQEYLSSIEAAPWAYIELDLDEMGI